MKQSNLVQKIVNEIRQKILLGVYKTDSHLSTQEVADSFMISRSPARRALIILQQQGYVELRKNKGFFVLHVEKSTASQESEILYLDEPAEYYRLAEDWLSNSIPSEVTELYLRKKYNLTKLQVVEILNKAASVGWAEQKSGYGWRFLDVAKTPEALEQIYRIRALIEPAALIDPSFRKNPDILSKLKKAQQDLLDGDIEKLPTEVLMKTGITFHEELTKLSGNPFYHMFVVQLNRMRRLIEYRSMIDRKRSYRQSREHIKIIELIENDKNKEAANLLRQHLSGALSGKSPTLKFKYNYLKKKN